LAPPGKVSKARANLGALRALRAVQAADRPATPEEQAVLARWAGWGALPEVFDGARDDWAWARTELAELLDEHEIAAAARSTINAHYTSAEVITAMWSTVTRLGFSAGRVLEPGIGSGNFLALRPDGLDLASVVGVELDPTTAGIARLLYPSADIRTQSFADTRLPEGHFDLAVGNVPFAQIVLHDRSHNTGGHSLHNYFLVKSLHLTRPGGVVAAVTSRWTMDARNPAARREIAGLADLLGAVRLPAGAFGPAAGTDAICDILFLRRREPDREPAVEVDCPRCQAGRCDEIHPGESWATVTDVDAPIDDQGQDAMVEVSEYFARHQHLILGELRAGGGQYNATELTVTPNGQPLADQLDDALTRLADAATNAGLAWTPAPSPARRLVSVPTARSETTVQAHHKEGSIVATATGGFARIVDGVPEPFLPSPKSQRSELRGLVDIRDATAAVLTAQAASRDDTAYLFAQQRLNRAYDAYVRRYGPLNRFKLVRTGRQHPDTGEDLYRRADPPMGGFRRDPDLYTVLALEVFDPETQTARKAPIFTRRVVGSRQPVLGADNAADALAVCLNETGTVEVARVAALLGVDADAARADLADLVFDDPATGGLVPAGRYLSGNVRAKLVAAEQAAAVDDRYRANVTALKAAVPADLGADEIRVRLGVPWIDATDITAFARETFAADGVLVEHAEVAAMWAVTAPSWQRSSVTMTSEWGTKRADAIRLLQNSLEQQPVKVFDTLDDGRRVLNSDETLAAREKQEAIEERFAAWVWEDPERTARLTERYNRIFNSLVTATYDGSHQTFPGLAESFTPRSHQIDSVWRIVSEPTVLLGHAVGAGKTATMVMAGMEMRRLGVVAKPAYVVPNHMLEQFTNELLQLYPQARVLVASKDATTPAARKNFVARCATGEWDAVIMTHSSFERIPVTAAAEAAYIDEQVAELRQAVAESERGAGLTVKRLQATLARAEERQKRLLQTAKEDDGVVFEQTGIDYLFVDEAHLFKNLALSTHIAGVNTAGSQRASDLHLKLRVLRERHGERVTTFATATYVTNTIAEMYTMQRYLQPSELARTGLSSFNAWAANFGRTVTSLELAPEGGTYRFNTRFARFVNVPELLTLFGQAADVRTADQLALPAPAVTGGQPETVVVAPSPVLEAYVAGLGDRAEMIRSRQVRPEEDNMLNVTMDGRKAALDLRLVGLTPDPDGGKIAVVAERTAAIWAQTRTNRYHDVDGEVHPRPGSLQLVFCDLGTPSDHWNVYQELKTQLVERGLAPEQIRFIHDAKGDKAKAELFAACRDGRVAVLVGSTEKMGMGTNVQARAVALHHVDCPWRPSDIEQRDGRALRQGNQNDEVQVMRYVTKRSFDVYSWQTVQRKAEHNHQVTRGEVTARDIDDIGDAALSASQAKALASGNPLIMERAGVEQELTKLERLVRAHQREQHDLTNRRVAAEARAERLETQAALVDSVLPRRIDTRADRFAMTVGDGPEAHRYTSRVDAGAAMRTVLFGLLDRNAAPQGRHVGFDTATYTIGEVGGFRIEADIVRHGDLPPYGEIRVEDLPVRRLSIERAELGRADLGGLATKIENRVLRLDDTAAALRREAEEARSETAAVAARIGRTFEHHDRIRELRSRLNQIDDALTPATPAATDIPPAADDGSPGLTATPTGVTARETPAGTTAGSPADVAGTRLTSTPAPAPSSTPDAAPPDAPLALPPGSPGDLSIHLQHQLHQQAAQAMSDVPPPVQP
jgi:N12 class adenine-specific DNA methylase